MLQTSSPPGCLCAFIPLHAHPYSMHPFTSKKNSYRDNTENTEKIEKMLPRGSKHPPYSEPSSSRLGLGSPRETNEAILIQIPSPHPLSSRYQGRRGAHKAFGVSWLNAPSPGSHLSTKKPRPSLPRCVLARSPWSTESQLSPSPSSHHPLHLPAPQHEEQNHCYQMFTEPLLKALRGRSFHPLPRLLILTLHYPHRCGGSLFLI